MKKSTTTIGPNGTGANRPIIEYPEETSGVFLSNPSGKPRDPEDIQQGDSRDGLPTVNPSHIASLGIAVYSAYPVGNKLRSSTTKPEQYTDPKTGLEDIIIPTSDLAIMPANGSGFVQLSSYGGLTEIQKKHISSLIFKSVFYGPSMPDSCDSAAELAYIRPSTFANLVLEQGQKDDIVRFRMAGKLNNLPVLGLRIGKRVESATIRNIEDFNCLLTSVSFSYGSVSYVCSESYTGVCFHRISKDDEVYGVQFQEYLKSAARPFNTVYDYANGISNNSENVNGPLGYFAGLDSVVLYSTLNIPWPRIDSRYRAVNCASSSAQGGSSAFLGWNSLPSQIITECSYCGESLIADPSCIDSYADLILPYNRQTEDYNVATLYNPNKYGADNNGSYETNCVYYTDPGVKAFRGSRFGLWEEFKDAYCKGGAWTYATRIGPDDILNQVVYNGNYSGPTTGFDRVGAYFDKDTGELAAVVEKIDNGVKYEGSIFNNHSYLEPKDAGSNDSTTFKRVFADVKFGGDKTTMMVAVDYNNAPTGGKVAVVEAAREQGFVKPETVYIESGRVKIFSPVARKTDVTIRVVGEFVKVLSDCYTFGIVSDTVIPPSVSGVNADKVALSKDGRSLEICLAGVFTSKDGIHYDKGQSLAFSVTEVNGRTSMPNNGDTVITTAPGVTVCNNWDAIGKKDGYIWKPFYIAQDASVCSVNIL